MPVLNETDPLAIRSLRLRSSVRFESKNASAITLLFFISLKKDGGNFLNSAAVPFGFCLIHFSAMLMGKSFFATPIMLFLPALIDATAGLKAALIFPPNERLASFLYSAMT